MKGGFEYMEVLRKLSSRKLWVTVLAFFGLIAIILNIDRLTTERVMGVMASFAILIIYVIGESYNDSKNVNSGKKTVETTIISKLQSRKFWAALISFSTVLMISLGCDTLTIEQVKALILAVASVAIYILGESFVDANRAVSSEIPQEIIAVETETANLLNSAMNVLSPLFRTDSKEKTVSTSSGNDNPLKTNVDTKIPNSEDEE